MEFDDYQGPSAVNGQCIVPIVAEIIHFDARCGNSGSHQQFPLILGWAISIHKSQGLTLKRVIVGIGNAEDNIGLTYVGCSRVKSWNCMAFQHSFPWERMEKINRHKGMEMIRAELERLSRLVS